MFSQKQIEKAMKRMGVRTEELEVESVVFNCKDKKIIIKNPSVSKIKMGGVTTFQVMGETEEKPNISEEDIKLIVEQTGCSHEEAGKALSETNDIAAAILKIKK